MQFVKSLTIGYNFVTILLLTFCLTYDIIKIVQEGQKNKREVLKMTKFNNSVKIAIEYKKGHMVYIKGDLDHNAMQNLQWYTEDYKCRKKVEFHCGELTIVFTGKNNVEMLQDKEFKKLYLHPDFNVLDNI